jgi:hypothetical protein
MANGNNHNHPFADWLAGGDWGDLLLTQLPQAAYYSSPMGSQFAQQSPRKGRYYQRAYQDVFSDYLGAIGSAITGGREPATFQSFLQTDPWTARYGRLPQFERGVTRTYTDPRTRFIFY